MAETEVITGGSHLVQRRAVRSDAFGKARRVRFLQVLAATSNVKAAAAAAGVGTATVYRVRQSDPAFAGNWREAMAAAYERLEAALLARALGTEDIDAAIDFGDPKAIFPATQIDADLALRLLGRHRATAEGRDRPVKRGRHIATEEETNKALLKQLAILRRQIERTGGAILQEDKR